MLDKSVPYVDVLMVRKSGTEIPVYELPEGFRFALFQDGDQKAWAKIEASVLEFDDALDALLYFQKNYLPYLPELERRCLFIENADGEKVATSMAWWGYTGLRRDPWLHWVAVAPRYQRLGLGKAIVSKVMRMTAEIEGDRDFHLHTQTWSHRAVKIYEKLGFGITFDRNIGMYSNENCEKALAILRSING